MKNSGLTLVFIIVCIAVLFVSYGVGLCIREIRFRHAAAVTSKTNVQSQIGAEAQKPSNITKPVNEPVENVQALPEEKQTPNNEGGRRFGVLSEEEMTQMRDRWQNMTDEERLQERERRRAEMAEMRAKMESMSEEEREQFRNEMRQRFGGDRQFPGRRSGRGQRQSEPNE